MFTLLGLLVLSACGKPPLPEDKVPELYNAPVMYDRGVEDEPMFDLAGFQLQKKRAYAITAKVLSVKDYKGEQFGDVMALDMALSWGELAKPEYDDLLRVTQRNRWYYWRAKSDALQSKVIFHNSSNHHLVPASNQVAETLYGANEGEVVVMYGYLVNIHDQEGKLLTETSLSRIDTGAGACEIMYVEEAYVYSASNE